MATAKTSTNRGDIAIVRRTVVLRATDVADAFAAIDHHWSAGGGSGQGAVTDELEFDAEGHRFTVSIRPLEETI